MKKKTTPKIQERRILFESKRFLVVEQDMEFSDGGKETWEAVELKGNGGSRVLGITDKQELIFIKEYRGAADKYVVRFPTGLIEEGETPAQAAVRELQEETGFQTGKLDVLGVLESTSGYYKAHALHVFVGRELKQIGELAREPGEQDMEVIYIPLQKAFAMAEQVEFEDTQTVYCVLLLQQYLKRESFEKSL